MIHKMPGQLGSLKPRKRKINSEAKSSRKASSSRRRCMKSPKMHSAADSGAAASGHSKADGPQERLSHISCECHQSAGRRRCTGSPELEGQEGKENELRSGLDVDDCRVNGVSDKQDPEDMDCEETNKNLFPDDDSNQILPVEQFFGNLDTVQDFPQRPSASSSRVRRQGRRRYYYAPEDSDEEEVGSSSSSSDTMQRDDRGDT
ncbi:UPF0688 protein C1orf174 homolog [Acanthopagrus latus]|uniref:UPF0688 protein C1orf174 homolog n=1 Tax=Acanthopagrus latus TaxID=8177 RepID=UPI00187BDD8A|nr:UPF0688 protein C1orf174 homolog [Acanthopagrus latus]